MDDDPRNSKKRFYSGLKSVGRSPQSDTRMYERRPNRGYDSQPSDYNSVKPQHLIDGNVEKYCHFAGVVKDIPPHIDITNRTDVLRIIDKGKQYNNIIYHNIAERLSVFSLSVNNVKIIPVRNEEMQPLFLRIPMQEIAAICYIKDDGQHILAIKHGTTELCHLAVLYVDTKQIAEEICSLVDVCFQLIYMDAAFDIIDTSNAGDSSRSNSTGSANPFNASFITTSMQELNTNQSRPSSFRKRSGKRVPSEPSTRGSDTGSLFQELLRDYMKKLHQKLDPEELRIFASLLPQLTSKTEFEDFCEKIYDLYGPERKYLLSEMSPFIPQDNYPHFEEFLRNKGVSLPEGGTLSSAHSNPAIYSRSVSDVSGSSTIANGNESLEHIMQIMSDVHRLDESNDVDYDPQKFMPGPDYNN